MQSVLQFGRDVNRWLDGCSLIVAVAFAVATLAKDAVLSQSKLVSWMRRRFILSKRIRPYCAQRYWHHVPLTFRGGNDLAADQASHRSAGSFSFKLAATLPAITSHLTCASRQQPGWLLRHPLKWRINQDDCHHTMKERTIRACRTDGANDTKTV